MRDVSNGSKLRAERTLTGRHVLIAVCAFFGIVFAVNGYFLFSALATHTGVVAVEPYRKGLAYNDRIAASDRQVARGWRDTVTASGDGTVAVVLADASGAAVPGIKLTGSIGRPSTAREDIALVFVETTPGLYRAKVTTLAPGAWIIALQAHSTASEPDYQMRRRLWLER